MANQYSSNIFLLYTIGNTIYGLWMLYTFLAVVVPREISAPMLYFAALGPLLRMLGITVQWFIWERKRAGVSQAQQEMMRVEIDNSIGFMQAIYPIIMSAAVGARLILSLLVGSCHKGSLDPVHTLCNNYSGQGGVSLSLTIELMFIPIVTFCLLRDTRFEALLTSWCINGANLISYGVILSSADITVAIILYLFFSTLIYADSQSRLVKTSGLVNRLQDSLAENERLAVEAQAIELRAMIGNIAHDLKSPLTSFLSGLECVLEVVSTWEQQLNVNHEQFMSRAYSNLATIKKCLHSMSGTNSFMTMTINRCLDYTKASKGFKLVPRLETVALKSVIDMPVAMMREVQGKIEIIVEPWEERICSHVITDKQWLLENLLCLLSNAVKYSHEGSVQVGVTLQQETQESNNVRHVGEKHSTETSPSYTPASSEHLRFAVLDRGIGLSEEAMQTLFNPFKQAQRLAGGTGLGLFSLAKRVEALHGTYGVSRRPDGERGSLFWFTIPYRPDTVSAALNSDSNSATASSPMSVQNSTTPLLSLPLYMPEIPDKASGGSQIPEIFGPLNLVRYNVLVVDDAPLIVRMTTMLLTRKGHTVRHAVNGAEGLDMILAGYRANRHSSSCDDELDAGTPPFDVVIMDLQMPIMDGIEAIRRLRAAESNFQRGVSLTTSSPHEESKFGGEEGELDLECGMKGGSSSGGKGAAVGIAIAAAQSQPQSLGRAHVPSFYHQYVVAVSANSDNDTVEEALRAGADSFIEKPFTYDCFQQVMQNKTPPPYPV